MAQWTLSAKHTGSFLGIAPTEKLITATGMSIQRFADGKIVEGWDNWDQLAVLTQLGVVSLDSISSGEKPLDTRVA
jgi:predicted ester cyclase